MKCDSKDIQQFLESAKQNQIDYGWAKHSQAVGDAAFTIAAALKQTGVEIDPEQVRLMGYVHDIGKLNGNFNFLGHLLGGYAYLKRQNFPEPYCTVPLTHSFIKNDPYFTLSGSVFEPEFLPSAEYLESLSDIIPEPDKQLFLINYVKNHDFTLAEKIVSLCDLMCFYDLLTLEQRMINIISRHGTWQNTQKFVNAALALKTDIDAQLGHSLYDLFPELKEHL